MSAGAPSRTRPSEREYRLEHSVDDPSDPGELTVFTPESSNLTTEWITIEYDEAVPSADWE
ncbi:MAG: hypothetical protein ABEJ05_12070 [Haloglomus sp.]